MHNPEDYRLKVYGSITLIPLLSIPVLPLCIGLIPQWYVAMVAALVLSVALYFYLRACYLFYDDRIVIKRHFRKDLVILHRRISEAKFLTYRRNTSLAIKHLHKGKETITGIGVGYDGPSVHGLFLRQGINTANESF